MSADGKGGRQQVSLYYNNGYKSCFKTHQHIMQVYYAIIFVSFFENAFDFVDTLGVSDNAPTTISSAQNQETATDTGGGGSPTGKLALQ